jgi:molybdopterin-guanine dinucleotide biosynthesis protein
MKNFKIEVGGVVVLIETDNFAEQLENKYREFITDKKHNFKIMFISRLNPINEITTGQFSEDKNNYLIKNEFLKLEIDKQTFNSKANIQVASFFESPIFSYTIRQALSLYLLEKGLGLVLHGCGIIKNNKGYLFCGPSGVGKTTLVEKTTNSDILNDDTIFLRTKDVKMFGTPFSRRNIQLNKNKKVDKIFFLRQGNELKIETNDSLNGLAALMMNTFTFPLTDLSKHLRDLIVIEAKEIVSQAETFILTSKEKDDVWSIIK